MKKEFMSKTIVVCCGALICCILWGSAFPCIKIGYGIMNISGDDIPGQILYAGCRFTLAGIMAIIFGSLIQKRFLYRWQQAVKKNPLCPNRSSALPNVPCGPTPTTTT